ncbi:hypothetical protein Glove_365g4 [Diversispora epigaea]|uniref:Protein kinase domain-containing protein n=1 Tax=Diversispora epigaea TaxID=1348612 RepID=A0A397H7W5_9GLOM|nr:hypothetical protein Glove_365g4 [Diversispora epigaea]
MDSYSYSSDIYSLGMIMWQLTSEHRPFHDKKYAKTYIRFLDGKDQNHTILWELQECSIDDIELSKKTLRIELMLKLELYLLKMDLTT